jgi:hypothetical protein
MNEGSRRYGQVLNHTAVHVDTGDLQRAATIGFTRTTRNAGPVIIIRDDGNGLAGLEARRLIEVDEVTGQFMTQDTGVLEIRLCAFEGVKVGAADADAFDLYDRMAGSRQRCFRFAISEFARLYAN